MKNFAANTFGTVNEIGADHPLGGGMNSDIIRGRGMDWANSRYKWQKIFGTGLQCTQMMMIMMMRHFSVQVVNSRDSKSKVDPKESKFHVIIACTISFELPVSWNKVQHRPKGPLNVLSVPAVSSALLH